VLYKIGTGDTAVGPVPRSALRQAGVRRSLGPRRSYDGCGGGMESAWDRCGKKFAGAEKWLRQEF